MIASFGKPRCGRVIVALLVMAWLPYTSTRCIEDSATKTGRRFLPAAPDGRADSHRGQGHAPHPAEGTRRGRDDHEHGQDPWGTCCESTGKYAFTVTSRPPAAKPTVRVVTLATEIVVTDRLPAFWHRPAQHLAHGPPAYLRYATLLI